MAQVELSAIGFDDLECLFAFPQIGQGQDLLKNCVAEQISGKFSVSIISWERL